MPDASRPLDLVHPLQGSDSRYAFSTGNTYPAVGVPRGMTLWTPQSGDGVFLFDRRHPKLAGIRATRSPSPWMGDFGHFDVTATLGPLLLTPGARAQAYALGLARSAPHRFEADLVRDGIGVAVTATDRCGVLRFALPPGTDEAFLVVQAGAGTGPEPSEARADAGRGVLAGVSRANHGGVAEGFGCRFVARVEGAEVLDAGVFTPAGVEPGRSAVEHPRAGAFLRIRPGGGGPVTLRIGTSFVDEAHAMNHLRREIGDRSFDEVAAGTAEVWDHWLGRFEDPPAEFTARRVFFHRRLADGPVPHADARAGPRRRARPPRPPRRPRAPRRALHEQRLLGHPPHRVPAADARRPRGLRRDRRGLPGVLPGRAAGCPSGPARATATAWSGRTWTASSRRRSSTGSPGFDAEEAYEAIRRNAFEPGDPAGRWGRLGLASYLEHGYVAEGDAPYSVCRTLDFAYCDWCVAQVARRVGRDGDAEELLRRSGNYRNLWHAGSGFMRPRRADGSWVEPWSEFGWGGAYIEGGPWQHSWTVPHDLDGLAELAGGREALADRLESLFTRPPRCEPGPYGQEIHEMTEMALAVDRDGRSFGQYAHSNQPSHAILWQLAELGRHGFVREQLRRVTSSLYTPEDLPGDEDNGEMSAWLVLASWGRYRLCPGSTRWTRLHPEAPPERGAAPRD